MFLGSAAGLFVGAIFTVLLAAVVRSDLAARRIPNRLVAVLVVTGSVAAATALREPVGFTGAIAGCALGLVVWLPFWLARVLGAGDVKLAAAIGVWLGPAGVLHASLLAALAGGVLALVVVARRGRLSALVTGLALWVGALQRGRLTRPLVNDTADLLPYGVALAVGAVLAGWLPAAWLAL